MTDIINSTDGTFEDDVLKSDKPVLVDFWAPWCGPCKAIAPVLDGLANDYDGKAQIVKVNIDDSKAIAAQYGIRGIPTLFVFKNGEKVDTLVGMQNKAQLSAVLDKHL